MAVLCTFCNNYRKRCIVGEMCSVCSAEADVREMEFLAQEAKSCRQCKDCKKPLPKSRYFRCLECIPDFRRESDDGALVYFENADESTPAPKDTRVFDGMKKCVGPCKETKSRNEFWRSHKSSGDTHRSYCKGCSKLLAAKWETEKAKRKEALAHG